jgi:CcmD family protein
MNFLYAAYTATWVIHIGYVVTLVLRYTQLKREIDDMSSKGS